SREPPPRPLPLRAEPGRRLERVPALSVAAEAPTEREQTLVPRRADRAHPLDRVLERRRGHLVARLAAGARRAKQPRVGQCRELLRNRLTSDRQLGRQLG